MEYNARAHTPPIQASATKLTDKIPEIFYIIVNSTLTDLSKVKI